jgi:hypothetical protein
MTEQTKKRIGMERSACKHEKILREFQAIALELGKLSWMQYVDIDMVRGIAKSKGIKFVPKNWLGSVFRNQKWECVGFTISNHKGSHGRIIRKWKIKQ